VRFEFFLGHVEALVALVGHSLWLVCACFFFLLVPSFFTMFLGFALLLSAESALSRYFFAFGGRSFAFPCLGGFLGGVRSFGFVFLAQHFYGVFLRRCRRFCGGARAASRSQGRESEGPEEPAGMANIRSGTLGWHQDSTSWCQPPECVSLPGALCRVLPDRQNTVGL